MKNQEGIKKKGQRHKGTEAQSGKKNTQLIISKALFNIPQNVIIKNFHNSLSLHLCGRQHPVITASSRGT